MDGKKLKKEIFERVSIERLVRFSDEKKTGILSNDYDWACDSSFLIFNSGADISIST